LLTVHLKDGVAEVRAGATLLYDSEPAAEERETRLKASAFLGSTMAAAASRVRLSAAFWAAMRSFNRFSLPCRRSLP